MKAVVLIDDRFININTNFRELILNLNAAFKNATITAPLRHHHDFPDPETGTNSTLLLMPAWDSGKEAGVKVITVNPENGKLNLPAIQGTYIYFDAATGTLKAIMEAKSLTAKRTAAASALASSFLSGEDASSLLMIGTGALSANLIQANASVRPIRRVYIWGRNFEKAQHIAQKLKNEKFSIQPIKTIQEKIAEVDIISCATLSKTPLISGKHIRAGQHIDLVGSYKTDMREADDETIVKASIFVDTFQGALKESGDIVIPLQSGILKEEEIKADLFQLCSGKKQGRVSPDEITLFKSVGHALEDLTAATYYYNTYTNQQQ